MKLRSKTFITFVILALIYASINLLTAPPRTSLQRYHMNATQLRLLNSTVVVPVIAIWFAALYGYTKLRRYTQEVQDSKDGEQFQKVSRGVMVLAWWLPISSTVSALLNFYARSHPGAQSTVTILVNYMSLLFPLVGFWLLNKACSDLSVRAKLPMRQGGLNWLILAVLAGGVIFAYLVAAAKGDISSVYHMPVALVLLTLVIPYVFSWYLGLLAVYDLHRYSQTVKGVIYRKSWNTLALGIGWIVVFAIILQYLTAVSAKLGDISLGWILTLIYGILIVLAFGYVFIARGAKQLTKIEEV